MGLSEIFEERVRAGISGMVVQTFEYEAAFDEIALVCGRPNNRWRLAVFDVAGGFVRYNDNMQPELGRMVPHGAEMRWEPAGKPGERVDTQKTTYSPQEAIAWLPYINGGLRYGRGHENEGDEIPSILVMNNHQRWIATPPMIQKVISQLQHGRRHAQYVVFLSVSGNLPEELSRLFEAGHIQHPLPTREELAEKAEGFVQQISSAISQPPLSHVVDAAAGLTMWGAENAFALSMIRHGCMRPDEVFTLKAEALAASASAIEMYRGNLTLRDYGGSKHLLDFCLELLQERQENPKYRPKGVFVVGPPGTGKTHLAKCLGSAVNRATAMVSLGAVKSKWQGESFSNLLNTIATLEAMAPLIVLLDEVEGQLSGGKDTGSMDAGTTSQINSKILSWLNDRDSDLFVVASCNDIRPIMRDMPEFTRAGRFDGMFFLDYPNRESKDAIWKIHLADFELLPAEAPLTDVTLPDDTDWTGSEIQACCRLAKLRKRSVAEIGETLPTIAKQAADKIEEIRNWADGRCYSADEPGIYYKNRRHIRPGDVVGASKQSARKRTLIQKEKS